MFAENKPKDFFKNKAEKEVSEENGDVGHNFHKYKNKDWFKIKAEKEVSEEAGDMEIIFFVNGTKAKLKSKIKAELKNAKKQDLDRIDEISEGDTEELKDVMELKKKKSLVFGIDCKVLKMLGFGENKIKLKNKTKKEQPEEAGDMVYNNKAGDMAFDFFKTKVMMCTENKFQAKLQEMSSALRVDRLAEDETAEQAGLEEQLLD